MKVTFDTKNAEEVMEVAILLANMKITLGIESKDAVKVTETPLKDTKEENTTPSIPEEENEPEKPKRKRRTKAEIEAEKDKTTSVSLADLKEVAQTKARIDRKKVKELISNYGEKLTDVNESDYAELLAKLNEL